MADKIEWPPFTITPNVIYDCIPLMKESEMKVVLIITRETFGWHVDKAKLKLVELMALTGLSKPSAIDGIKDGMKRGLIDRELSDDGQTYLYFLAMEPPPERVKNLVSEAKVRQLKTFTENHETTVKFFNRPPYIKKGSKETGEGRDAPSGDKNPAGGGSRDKRAAARALFERWQEIFEEPEAIFTTDREAVALERLEQFTPERIELAFHGILHSDHHMGRNKKSNPRGLKWNRFEWILKKPERVEQFAQRELDRRAAEEGGGGVSETTRPGRRTGARGRGQSDGAGAAERSDLKVDSEGSI